MTPDYVICVECETPCYVFEWQDERVREAFCEACGNDDPELFLTEAEYEDLAQSQSP